MEGEEELVAAIQKNTTLSHLDLTDNFLGAINLKPLAAAFKASKGLTSLKLGMNAITDAGIEELATFYENNNTITHLDLNTNNITKTGAMRLATALKECSSLMALDLGRNPISDEGAEALDALILSNPNIMFACYMGQSAEAADALQERQAPIKELADSWKSTKHTMLNYPVILAIICNMPAQ